MANAKSLFSVMIQDSAGNAWEKALEYSSIMAETEVELETATFSALVSACEKTWERRKKALQLACLRTRGALEPDTNSFNALIGASLNHNRLRTGC